VPAQADAQDKGGYAKEASAEFKKAQEEALRKRVAEADAVICTALVPGRPAPKLLPASMVQSMRRGSVVVDLAAEQGGNCALTERDKVVERYGVTIIGVTDLTSRLSRQASELYSANIVNLLEDYSFEVVEAKSREEVLESAKASALWIIDVRLPSSNMEGILAVHELARRGTVSAYPVIFVSVLPEDFARFVGRAALAELRQRRGIFPEQRQRRFQ